jgi:hypothetical protein
VIGSGDSIGCQSSTLGNRTGYNHITLNLYVTLEEGRQEAWISRVTDTSNTSRVSASSYTNDGVATLVSNSESV